MILKQPPPYESVGVFVIQINNTMTISREDWQNQWVTTPSGGIPEWTMSSTLDTNKTKYIT